MCPCPKFNFPFIFQKDLWGMGVRAREFDGPIAVVTAQRKAALAKKEFGKSPMSWRQRGCEVHEEQFFLRDKNSEIEGK